MSAFAHAPRHASWEACSFCDHPELVRIEGELKSCIKHPGTPSVLFFKATLPLKPATIALKIGHLAFQDVLKTPHTVTSFRSHRL